MFGPLLKLCDAVGQPLEAPELQGPSVTGAWRGLLLQQLEVSWLLWRRQAMFLSGQSWGTTMWTVSRSKIV